MDYINEIKSRKEDFLDYYSTEVKEVSRGKQGFWISAVYFDKYEKTGDTKALKIAREMFEVSINTVISSFELIGGLYHYHKCHHLYDYAMLQKFKEVFTTTKRYDKERYTANHLLMSVISRYLAEELFPGEIETYIFEDDKTCEDTLNCIIEEYVHEGDPEWNSKTYFAMHYIPLWLLGEYARNKDLKNKGKLSAEWLLVKATSTWLQGHWAIPQERAYNPFARQDEYSAGTVILMLLFGGVKIVDYNKAEAHFAVPIALSDYTPPKILYDILKDRKKAYAHKERHYYYLRDRIHFYDPNLTEEGRMSVENDVFHTSFVNKTYAVFSSVECVEPKTEYLEFMDRYYIQMHRWGVCLTGRKGPTVFYLEHPSGVKVSNSGATAWERVLQHEGSLIGIYNVPRDRKSRYLEHFLTEDLRRHPQQTTDTKFRPHNHHIMGYIPTVYDDCINDCTNGRVYLNYGDFMLALYISESFNWHSSDSSFRHETQKSAFVVETSDKFSSLADFKKVVDVKFDKTRFDKDNLILDYSSIRDIDMSLQFIEDGTRNDLINGEKVVYVNWPLIDNPWMKQAFKGDILYVKHLYNQLRYDFTHWMKIENYSIEGVSCEG